MKKSNNTKKSTTIKSIVIPETLTHGNKELKNMYRLLTKKEVELIDLMNKDAYEEAKSTKSQMIAQNIIQTGVQTMAITGRTWFVAEVPSNLIVVDIYQRPLNKGKVTRLADEFNWDYVNVKTVNYRPEEGVFALIDGHHTNEILKLKNERTICCRVFVDYTYQQEAGLFAEQNHGVTKLSVVSSFFAKTEAGDPIACGIMELFNKYGLTYGLARKKKQVTSIRKVQNIAKKDGLEALDFTFKLIFDAGWGEDDASAFQECGLNAGYYAYIHLMERDGQILPNAYKKIVKFLKQFKTSKQFQDYADWQTGEIHTKHPELAIKDVMPEVVHNPEKKVQYKGEKLIKVEE